MNELSISVLLAVGRTTILLAVAALVAGGLLGLVRSSSPVVHRMAWCLVLVVGWLFLRVPVAIPYGESVAQKSRVRETHQETTKGVGAFHAPYKLPDATPMAPDVDVAALPKVPVSKVPVSRAVLPQADPTRGEVATPRAVRPWWPSALIAFWLSGILCLLAGWTGGYVWFVFRLRWEKSPKTPAEAAWTDQWEDLLARRGVGRSIAMRVTSGSGPMLLRLPRGYCLLVPRELWQGLTPSGRLAILRHELAHYHRADTWKSLAVRLLTLPHWFNPAAWWAVRKFDSAAEWACDRRAVDSRPEEAPDYARTLVEIGELAGRSPSFARAFRGHGLSVRVRRLLDSRLMKEDSMMKKMLVIGVSLGLVAVCLIRFDLVPAAAPEAGRAEAAWAVEAEAPAAPVRPKKALRYDGRSFDEWRDELETELKPERRTEAIKAFAAFGANGYGREAAEVIVGVMRGYDASRMDSGPMKELKNAAISAFRNPEIDRGDGITPIAREDGFAVLLEELKHGPRNGRLFVVTALWEMAIAIESEEVVPLLIEILETEKDAAMWAAAAASLQVLDKKGVSAPTLLKIVRDAKAGSVRQRAFWALSQVDQNGESIADGLRAIIQEGNTKWFRSALGSLIPKMGSGRGRWYGVGLDGIFRMSESSGGYGGMDMGGMGMGGGMMGGGYGGGSETAPKRELAPKAGPVIKVIVEAMDDEREAIRHAAFEAVGRMGPEAKGMVDDLIRRFEKAPVEDRLLIIKAMGAIGPAAKEVAPLLAEAAAQSKDEQITSAALSAMATILGRYEDVERMYYQARQKLSEAADPFGAKGNDDPFGAKSADDPFGGGNKNDAPFGSGSGNPFD